MAAGQVNSYQREWQAWEEIDYTISFDKSYQGKAMWQWQFSVTDSYGSVTTPKTIDYAITENRATPPLCLPGYDAEQGSVSYQQCTDAEHTLPSGKYESAVVV